MKIFKRITLAIITITLLNSCCAFPFYNGCASNKKIKYKGETDNNLNEKELYASANDSTNMNYESI